MTPTGAREDVLSDWTGADAIAIVIGLALLVLILALGWCPRRWVDRAASEMPWLVERIRRLWR